MNGISDFRRLTAFCPPLETERIAGDPWIILNSRYCHPGLARLAGLAAACAGARGGASKLKPDEPVVVPGHGSSTSIDFDRSVS